jgi:flagellar biosynthesis protein FlhG
MTDSAQPAVALTPGAVIQPLRGRNLIAIASGKGGVGKTWFSITLSQALSKMGRKVLLFDGDLGLANVDIQLGLMPERDLGAVIDRSATLEQVAQRYPAGGFEIVAGRSGSGSLASLTTQRLSELRNDLLAIAPKYDHVLLDCGAGIDRNVRVLSGPAGTTLVVTNDEPTAITDAYAFIKVTYATNPAADIRIIVNQATTPRDGERTYSTILKACENFLGKSPGLGGIIRRDPRVPDTIRHQSPLLTRSPNTEAAEDVERIAAVLAEPK